MPIINNKVHRKSVSNLSNLEVPWIVQEQNGWSGYARILRNKQSNPPLTHFFPKYNCWMPGWFHQLISIPDGAPRICCNPSLPHCVLESGIENSYKLHPITGILTMVICFYMQSSSHFPLSLDEQTIMLEH